MNDTKKTKVITFRITRQLHKKLAKHTKKTGLTPSQFIRKVLSEKLKNIR